MVFTQDGSGRCWTAAGRRERERERTSTYSRSKPTDVDANRSPVTVERVLSCVSGAGAVGVGRLPQEDYVSVECFGDLNVLCAANCDVNTRGSLFSDPVKTLH